MQNRQIAIFNLDGSVANDVWRRPFLHERASLGSQSEYHHKHSFDQPTKGIGERFADLRRRGVHIVFYTGRPLAYWDSTKQWLLKHFGFEIMKHYELFMRPTYGSDASETHATLSDVELKRYIIRTLKSRPATEIFSASDCDVEVLRMLREEGLTAIILDCEEGYRDPNKVEQPQDAFKVAAQDFALKATGKIAGLPAAAHGFFAVDLSATQPIPGVAAFEDRNEVQDHWKETANATIKAGQEVSHEVRLNSNYTHEERERMRALERQIRGEREEREPVRVVTPNAHGPFPESIERYAVSRGEMSYLLCEPGSVRPDYSEAMRLIGIENEPKIATGVFLDAKMPTPTAQEAAQEAVKSFPWNGTEEKSKPVHGPEKSIAEAMDALDIIRRDSKALGSLMEFFFPDGLKAQDATDYEFISLLQTAFYSLNEFVKGGMHDYTTLKQVILFMSALEPLLGYHTVESLDEGDHAG